MIKPLLEVAGDDLDDSVAASWLQLAAATTPAPAPAPTPGDDSDEVTIDDNMDVKSNSSFPYSPSWGDQDQDQDEGQRISDCEEAPHGHDQQLGGSDAKPGVVPESMCRILAIAAPDGINNPEFHEIIMHTVAVAKENSTTSSSLSKLGWDVLQNKSHRTRSLLELADQTGNGRQRLPGRLQELASAILETQRAERWYLEKQSPTHWFQLTWSFTSMSITVMRRQ